ncbi:hypothetical protein F4811DRAFT_549931 [Daldinia bambusicola]|nr:hypothetical protein F4811DRAFT_549931 [Daldinia bambusicola]
MPLEIISPQEQTTYPSIYLDEEDQRKGGYVSSDMGFAPIETSCATPLSLSLRDQKLHDITPESAHMTGSDQYKTLGPGYKEIGSTFEPGADLTQLGWSFQEPNVFLPVPETTKIGDATVESLIFANDELNASNLNNEARGEFIGCSQPTQPPREFQCVRGIDTNRITRPDQCLHLHRVILLIYELDDVATGIENVDNVLNTNKSAIQHGNDMIDCKVCMASLEDMAILTYLVGKLGKKCQDISGAYSRPVSTLGFRGNSQTTAPKLGLGSYVVDSPVEFKTLVKGLLSLQVQSIQIVSILKQSLKAVFPT